MLKETWKETVATADTCPDRAAWVDAGLLRKDSSRSLPTEGEIYTPIPLVNLFAPWNASEHNVSACFYLSSLVLCPVTREELASGHTFLQSHEKDLSPSVLAPPVADPYQVLRYIDQDTILYAKISSPISSLCKFA